MGMMDLLYRTYEYAYEAEDAQQMENYLMSQTTATAPILLWLNERGEFADAGYIPDKEKQKISILYGEISRAFREESGSPSAVR